MLICVKYYIYSHGQMTYKKAQGAFEKANGGSPQKSWIYLPLAPIERSIHEKPYALPILPSLAKTYSLSLPPVNRSARRGGNSLSCIEFKHPSIQSTNS